MARAGRIAGPGAARALVASVSLLALSCGRSRLDVPRLGVADVKPTEIEPLVLAGDGAPWFSGARSRRPVYLTGSHTWNNFQDWDDRDPPRPFDFDRYLDFLARHGHNLIRLYVWEQAAWFPGTDAKVVIAPLPYSRTGPGLALDGKPRFDLSQLDPAYFARLRDRVTRAGARGIYVSVMLFDGWSIESKGEKSGNPWRGHPFNRANNVNGIDGDTDGDGEGTEVHTLSNPAVTEIQKRYLARVVETLRDQENVLFEISNESAAGSVDWQYEMLRTIRELEAGQPVRHPVGMTAPYPEDARGNMPLVASSADWISPEVDPSKADDLQPSAGPKIVLSDTDHIFGVGGSPRWVWETFVSGGNPIFMDPCVTEVQRNRPAWSAGDTRPALSEPCSGSRWEAVRRAMGQTRAFAQRLRLGSLRSMPELCSTHHCLAEPGQEYVVYVPLAHGRFRRLLGAVFPRVATEKFDLDLSAARGALSVEWVNTESGEIVPGRPVMGGSRVELRPPFAVDVVLHARLMEPS